MIKRVFALFLTCCLLLSLFAGCGKTEAAGSTEELEKGWYSLTDEDGEIAGYLYSTGKKLTSYDAEGEELMEESKFKYDEEEEAFVIDDTAAFSLTVSRKTTTITVPKKSPLGISKGDYTLTAVDEDEVGGGAEGAVDKLEKGWYEIADDGEVLGYLYSTGKKIAAFDAEGEELMEETKFSYDEEEGAFLIDDTPAFSLEKSKDGYTVTIPKKSPLPFDKGEYSAKAVKEDQVGGAATAPAAVTEPENGGETPAAAVEEERKIIGTWSGTVDFGEALMTAMSNAGGSFAEVAEFAEAPLNLENLDLTVKVKVNVGSDGYTTFELDTADMSRVTTEFLDGVIDWVLVAMEGYIKAMCKASGMSLEDFYALVEAQYGKKVSSIVELLPLMDVDIEEIKEDALKEIDLSDLSITGYITMDGEKGVFVATDGKTGAVSYDGTTLTITVEDSDYSFTVSCTKN